LKKGEYPGENIISYAHHQAASVGLEENNVLHAASMGVAEEAAFNAVEICKHYILFQEENRSLFTDKYVQEIAHEIDFSFEIMGIVFEGRIDRIVQHKLTDKCYIIDYKTTANIGKKKEALKYSWQTHIYQEAVKRMFPEVELGGIVYRLIKSTPPTLPRLLKSGGYSQAKTSYSTASYFWQALTSVFPDTPASELLEEYGGYLKWLQDNQTFFVDVFFPRDDDATLAIMCDAVNIAAEMEKVKYASYRILGEQCVFCSFKQPCDAATRRDIEEEHRILSQHYISRTDQEHETEG
jgi:hypothetical protein